jgi:hypothetical protein
MVRFKLFSTSKTGIQAARIRISARLFSFGDHLILLPFPLQPRPPSARSQTCIVGFIQFDTCYGALV